MNQPRIAILLYHFAQGGVERMLVHLARGFSAYPIYIDFILKEEEHKPYLNTLPETVQRIFLPQKQTDKALLHYLHTAKPDILLTAKIKDDQLAIHCLDKIQHSMKFIPRVGTHITQRLQAKKSNFIKQFFEIQHHKKLCRFTDTIIAVSEGVGEDLQRILPCPEKVKTLPNPTIPPELDSLAAQPVSHPWLEEQTLPVILGIGRMAIQKDFISLIQAFAIIQKQYPARLIILGQGRDYKKLVKLRQALNLEEFIDFPGFTDNIYAYLSKTNLFVLSSLWEGSPNALVEALACGTPVVATDCPSGPRQILQNGKYGALVPLKSPLQLAEAILKTLKNPLPPATLKVASKPYTIENSTRYYLNAFGLSKMYE